MNAADKKNLRMALLRWCQGRGITRSLALTYARNEGFRGHDLPEMIEDALKYMAHPTKGLVEVIANPAEPNDPRYHTTPSGEDVLTGEEEA